MKKDIPAYKVVEENIPNIFDKFNKGKNSCNKFLMMLK